MFGKAIKDLQAGLKLYPVWAYQAYHDLTVKYKRTVLGTLWLSGSTVFTSIAMAIVFGGLFGQSLQEAIPYCMAGLLAAGLCFYPITDATETLISNSGVIRNHAYPFTYFTFEHVARQFFLFLHNVPIYFALIAIVGAFKVPHWSLIVAIPLILGVMFVWGMVTSMFAARYRDMRFLLPYLGQMLFFLTPLYWHADGLKGWRSAIAEYNPFYSLVQIVRAPLMGREAEPNNWMISVTILLVGIVVWSLGFGIFRRKIPFWV